MVRVRENKWIAAGGRAGNDEERSRRVGHFGGIMEEMHFSEC